MAQWHTLLHSGTDCCKLLINYAPWLTFCAYTGGLVVLMAGVGWERAQAVACLTALMQLMQCKGLSADQVSEVQVMLARMQGVHRLSALLCLIEPQKAKKHA